MSGTLKPYPKYKESGVEWLGAVPEEWEVLSLKFACALKSGDQISSDDIVDTGKYAVYGGNGLRGYTSEYNTEGTFPLIGRQGALCGNINMATGRFWASEHAIVARPRSNSTVPEYVLFLLQVMNLGQYSVSAAQPGIGVESIGSVRTTLPTPDEQQAIADYLDTETQRIDTLIAELREMIGLLKEKRQALISHCVTNGLDPTVPMKDSGVEWLGEVPEGWEVVRMGLVASVSNGTTPSRDNPNYWKDGTIPWVSSAEVNQGHITSPSDFVTVQATIDNGMKIIHEGSVLIGLIGQGRTRGMSALLTFDACINQNVAAIEPHGKASARFIRHYLRHAYEPIRQLGRGGQQDALNNELVRSIIMPVPPLPEQHAIATHLDRETTKIDRLISETESTIALMQERRSALISSVVTGKLQVPGVPQPSGSTSKPRSENPPRD